MEKLKGFVEVDDVLRRSLVLGACRVDRLLFASGKKQLRDRIGLGHYVAGDDGWIREAIGLGPRRVVDYVTVKIEIRDDS